MFFFFLKKKKKKKRTTGNIKLTFPADGACAPWFISLRVDCFLLYITFLTPIKIFIVIPDIQKKLSVGERKDRNY